MTSTRSASANDTIDELLQSLAAFKPGHPLKNYITHATFPNFKNLERGTRIDFNFPLTALVGANGIGKSSVIHALWGMPLGYSTARFWFATELDPIEEKARDLQRYFYGHWSDAANGVVETRKARIGKKRGGDYWEPYRWSARDGMAPLPAGSFEGKHKDRWNPVNRRVVYINLKSIFGSFDRYFQTDAMGGGLERGERREAMLREARRLKRVKDASLQTYKLGGQERVFENRQVTKEELAHIEAILGRKYDSAHIIRHALYVGNRGADISVVFQRGVQYSEAFAGSGELAVVSAVIDILRADKYSLILLDEPETSLHPGAQRALLRFLLEQIKLKKHQIIISTHSSEFLVSLPHQAIKVFEDNGAGRTRILPKSSPHAAFNRLGKPPEHVLRILVEDPIAELLVRHAARELDEGDAARLDVRVAPGGAESILKYLVPSALISGDDLCFFLDGDKKRVEHFSDPDQIPPAAHPELGALIKSEVGLDPLFNIPGGADAHNHKERKVEAQLGYLAMLRKRLDFLPLSIPEAIVLAAFSRLSKNEESSTEIKKEFRKLITNGVDIEMSSDELLPLAKLKIAAIGSSDINLTFIRTTIQFWLGNIKT